MAYQACPAPAHQDSCDTSATSLSNVTASLHSAAVWLTNHLTLQVERFARFTEIRRQRRMLLTLNDQQLRDIGITRADAEEEYRRSFKSI